MKPTLFVLAAGMGSRYGGLKQLDGLGPNGETIMDYSIFDAIRGGFGKLVFVIRKDFEQDFRDKVLSKYEGHIPTELVFQAIDNLPEGFTVPEERTKPWGTNHAVLMGKDAINEPFAVINADDFYGYESFAIVASFLNNNSEDEFANIGYLVKTPNPYEYKLNEQLKIRKEAVDAEGNVITKTSSIEYTHYFPIEVLRIFSKRDLLQHSSLFLIYAF